MQNLASNNVWFSNFLKTALYNFHPISDITVNVNDCVPFSDQLVITIDNGNRIEIDLSVTGVGNTVVSEPPMNPHPLNGIDLGPLFSTQRTSRKIKLINKVILNVNSEAHPSSSRCHSRSPV